jgi:hypothetical protein
MAQYTGGYVRFVDWHCQYEWTQECDQQVMEEERFYRSQMLKQAEQQNKILEENQRLQKRQLRDEEQERSNQRFWRFIQ